MNRETERKREKKGGKKREKKKREKKENTFFGGSGGSRSAPRGAERSRSARSAPATRPEVLFFQNLMKFFQNWTGSFSAVSRNF